MRLVSWAAFQKDNLRELLEAQRVFHDIHVINESPGRNTLAASQKCVPHMSPLLIWAMHILNEISSAETAKTVSQLIVARTEPLCGPRRAKFTVTYLTVAS